MQVATFSHNSQMVAVANYFHIIVYEAQSGKQLKSFSGHPVDVPAAAGHVEAVTGLAFSKDDAKLISVGWDRSLKVWDLASGKEEKTFPEAEPINTCVLIADGSWVLTGSAGSIHLWNLNSSRLDTAINYDGEILSMGVLRNGEYFATGDDRGTITIWDAATLGRYRVIAKAHNRGVWSIAVTTDGRTLASGGEDGKVILWPVAYLLQGDQTQRTTPSP